MAFLWAQCSGCPFSPLSGRPVSRLCIPVNNPCCTAPGQPGLVAACCPAQDTLLYCLSRPLALGNDSLCNRHVRPHGHKEGWQDGSFLSSGSCPRPQTSGAAGSNDSERQTGLTPSLWGKPAWGNSVGARRLRELTMEHECSETRI